MSHDLIVNGFRIDNLNNLNYTKMISENLYIGFLSRNNIAWGDGVLFGISFNTDLPIGDISELIADEEMDTVEIYATLFLEGETNDGTVDDDTIFWKLRRVNYKWVLIESHSYKRNATVMEENDSETTTKYLDYIRYQNMSYTNMFIHLWDMSTPASPVWLTQIADEPKPLGIRVKVNDLDFYNANKKVHLCSSGSVNPVEGFMDLYLLENSMDPNSIKIVGVPETTIALLTTGQVELVGRYFDIVDAYSNKIIIRNIKYDEWITLQNINCLKFSYPTQLGEKVVLVTTNIYEGVYEIYPDFSIDLITELVNDNMPPGLDITYMLDNFVKDSLFLKGYSIAESQGLDDLDFIKLHKIDPTTQIKFVSLANAVNSVVDGVTGEYLDDNIFVGLPNTTEANWEIIKELNLNKLFLTYTLTVDTGTSLPVSGTAGDLFYKTDDRQLYIYEATWEEIPNDIRQIAIFHIQDIGEVSENIDLIYINNINKIQLVDNLTVQLVL